MKKRILSILLTAVMVLTMIPFAAFTTIAASSYTASGGNGNVYDETDTTKLVADSTWYDADATDLYIWDESDLIAYGSHVKSIGSYDSSKNNVVSFAGQVIHIMADLDMTGVAWYDIIGRNRAFSGFIDGHNHTISNITYTAPTGNTNNSQGAILAGRLHALSTSTYIYNKYGAYTGVKDLTISNSAMTVMSATQGGLFGITNGDANTSILIENVAVDIDITTSAAQVGGFLGYTNANIDHRFENCVYKGKISCSVATSYAGGFIGLAKSAKTLVFNNCEFAGTVGDKDYLGGFIGRCDVASLVMTDCVSSGTVAGAGAHVGGFVADHRSVKATFTNCISTAKLSGGLGIGGFIGWELAVDDNYENCVFNGTISGTYHLGGFIGKSQGMNANSDNKININGCVSVGSITSSHKNGIAGGFVGLIGSTGGTTVAPRESFVTITNSAFYGSITANADETSSIGAVAGQTNYSTSASVSSASSLTVDNVIVGGAFKYGDSVTTVNNVAYILGSNTAGNTVTASDVIAFTTDAKTTLAMVAANEGTWSVAATCVTESASNMEGVNAAITSAFSPCFVTMPTGNPMPLGVVNMVRTGSNATQYIGYQEGTNSLRFVAGGDDSTYSKVGFDISVYANNSLVSGGNTAETSVVYNSITGTVEGVTTTYTNSDLGVNYLYTYICENIPTDIEITFAVITYHIEGTATVYDDVYVVTVNSAS